MAGDPDETPEIRRGKGLRLSTRPPTDAPRADAPSAPPQLGAAAPGAATPAADEPAGAPASPVRHSGGLRLSTQAPVEPSAAASEGAAPATRAEPPAAAPERDARAARAEPPATAPAATLERGAPRSVRQRITTARGQISYLQAGNGSPLILLHGWGASARVWEGTLAALADLRAAYALDLPGFGESPARAATPTLMALADEVIAFADALGLEQFDLLGHALGAAVATCVASRLHQRRVGRLIVTSLGARMFAPDLAVLDLTRSPLDLTMGLARPLLNLWQSMNRAIMQSPPLATTLEALLIHRRPASAELWQNYLADHAAADGRAYLTALTAAGDLALHDALRAIFIPTLCLAGREDRLVSLTYANAAHELIAGSILRVIDDCGHIPMIEQPEVFHQAVREFLKG